MPADNPFDIDTAPTAWTHFWDMHSGGGQKLDWANIFIEAPEAEAKVIFYNRFGRNPERVTCTCCGEDYSIDESPTLAKATAYQRGLRYVSPKGRGVGHYLEPGEPVPKGFTLKHEAGAWGRPERSLRDYIRSEGVKVIQASEILPSERTGHVPPEGYVWAGEDP
jgi:hypothetical protein